VRRSPLILVALLLASFTINLDTTIVNVALPRLAIDLHATNSQLQWIVDAYNLTFASLLLAAGSLSDRFGRKGMMLAGLGVFGVASLAGGLTSNLDQLIVARCFMGVGAAMVFPSTLSLIVNVFTERAERARAIGLWTAVAGMAIAMGPIVSGWLLEHYEWKSIFFVMAPAAAVTAALVAWKVPTSRDPRAPKLDRLGFVLATAAMGLLVYTIIEAPDYGWSSPRSMAGFILATGLFGAFVAWERRVEEPMLDIELFKNPRFTAASGSVTVAFFTLFGFIFLVTQYFQFFKHYGPLSTGVHMLPFAFSVGLGSIVGTKLALRFGNKVIVTMGLLAVAGFYEWASTVETGTSYALIACMMGLFGLGMGFTAAPATESIMGVVSKHKAGVGSAINDATRLTGGTLGVAVIGSIYASLYKSRLTSALPVQLPHALAHVAQSSAGAALAVARHLNADGWTELGGPVHNAATQGFHDGLSAGCVVAGGLAVLGAVMAAIWLPAQPHDEPISLPGLPLAGPAVTD
jgi:EmrB/QacA subfamily drug resistance transporter